MLFIFFLPIFTTHLKITIQSIEVINVDYLQVAINFLTEIQNIFLIIFYLEVMTFYNKCFLNFQLINLAAHLKKMKKDVIRKIPDPDYSGLAIIDWEGWRPTWDRNFDSKRIYQSRSIELVQEKHPEWSMEEVIMEAKQEFERSARGLMESSIKLARQLRPKGLWGFYGFPDCFGKSETNYRCSYEVGLMYLIFA